jgi:hypothetical protein
MSADSREPADDDTSYKHRSCLACGKRIPRWSKGRQTPITRQFCGAGCRAYWHRAHPNASRTENAKKVPARQAFLEPVCATERPPEYADCEACGRTCRIKPDEPTYCSEQCRSYVPLPARKPAGEWFIIAGPVDYCAACSLAITPTKSHGHLMPWRRGSALFCSADCRRARHKADEWLEGAAS